MLNPPAPKFSLRNRSGRAAVALLVACVALAARAQAIDIVFDYRYDTSGFFTNNPAAKTDLEAAAQTYEMKLGDTLSAITPSGQNTWTANFYNPATLATTSLSNLTIAQNAILVFVGGANLGSGNELGQGGYGGYGSSGTATWNNTVAGRGQSGALSASPTDFGPWGGAISFSNTASWYFDADPSTKENFSGQNDFYSVAIHELGHVLGIGTAGSWEDQITSDQFTGAKSESVYGGAVPLDAASSDGHWASGTMSTIYGTNTPQEVVLDPSITTGTRKILTTLDVAGLQDIGWIIVPEPSSLLLLGSIFTLRLMRRRR